MKNFIFAFLWLASAMLPRAATEYCPQGTFSGFPTPPSGSYTNSTASTGYGAWNINFSATSPGAAGNYDLTNAGGLGLTGISYRAPYPIGTVDIVATNSPIAPPGATNVLIDLVGPGGTNETPYLYGGCIWQNRNNLTAGNRYTLTIVTEAKDNRRDRGNDMIGSIGVALRQGGSAIYYPPNPFSMISPGSQVGVTLQGSLLPPWPDGWKYTYCSDSYVYGGTGNPLTNTVRVNCEDVITSTNYWTTNSWTFTAVSTDWYLFIYGTGVHRTPLLRSVSIQDAP